MVTTLHPGFVRTAMTAGSEFVMPGLMDADEAARRMLRAIARRRKTYDFPASAAWMMRIARWLPDWLLARSMNDYNQKAAAAR